MSNKNTTIAIKAKNETASGITGAINQLKGLDANVSKISKTFESLGKLSIVAAMTSATKAAVDFSKECITDFGEVQRTMTQLFTSIGGDANRFEALTGLIDSLSYKTMDSKDSVEKLVAELASLGKSDTDIKRISEACVALSNITGDSLETSFTKINATFSGTAKSLVKLVPEIGNLSAEQMKAGGVVDLLNNKFGAISDSMGNGVSQTMHNLTLATDELKEAIGEGLAPTIEAILPSLTEYINKLTEALKLSTTQASVGYDLNKGYAGPGNKYDVGRYATDINGLSTQEQLARLRYAKDYISLPGLKGQNEEGIKLLTQYIAELTQKAKEEARTAGSTKSSTPSSSSSTPSTTTKDIKNADWGDVKADSTPWALLAKLQADGVESMNKVAIELEARNFDHAYDTTGATTSYSSGITAQTKTLWQDFKAGFSDVFQSLKGNGAFDGIASAVEPLANIITPIIQGMGAFNIGLAVLSPVVQGFVSVIQPALSTVIEPVMTALSNIGGLVAGIILPILEQLTPIFNLIAQILMTVLSPIIQLIGASLSPIASLLQLLTPVMKAIAIAFTVLMAPVKWLADLFTWVGETLKTFVYNITHPFDGRSYSSFYSDAFSGLGDRIAAINNSGNVTPLTGSASSGSYSGGSSPSWTGPQTLNVNVYQYGVYTDMEEVKKQTTKAVMTALEESDVYGD